MVEYKYDAWGKPVSVSTLSTAYDTLASLNPFRYPGYVWDEETGWYYLRSRYYSPEWGRFINADILLGKTAGLLSHNGFAYCGNSPLLYSDPSGCDTDFDDSLSRYGTQVNMPTWIYSERDFGFGVGTLTNSSSEVHLNTITPGVLPTIFGLGSVFGFIGYIFLSRKKPINLPSYDRLSINISHIMTGHGKSSKRGPNNDRFPDWITPEILEKIIEKGYRYAKRIKTQEEKIEVIIPWGHDKIRLWIDTINKVIDTAFPKYTK